MTKQFPGPPGVTSPRALSYVSALDLELSLAASMRNMSETKVLESAPRGVSPYGITGLLLHSHVFWQAVIEANSARLCGAFSEPGRMAGLRR